MKWSFAAVGVVVAGLVGLTILLLFQQVTVNNEQDYYLLKEVTEAAMTDSIDIAYYRSTGKIKIVQEKFVENFTRRFAESTNLTAKGYKIEFYDIIEMPPKVTVRIYNRLGNYTVYGNSNDYEVVNELSAILETKELSIE